MMKAVVHPRLGEGTRGETGNRNDNQEGGTGTRKTQWEERWREVGMV